MPPLRERKEDIPLLVEHFLGSRPARGRRQKRLADGRDGAARAYDWPGNVRELENEVKRMIALGDDVISPECSPSSVRRGAGARSARDDDESPCRTCVDLVERVERTRDREGARLARGNKTRAAEALGISRFTLQRKLEKYGMPAE